MDFPSSHPSQPSKRALRESSTSFSSPPCPPWNIKQTPPKKRYLPNYDIHQHPRKTKKKHVGIEVCKSMSGENLQTDKFEFHIRYQTHDRHQGTKPSPIASCDKHMTSVDATTCREALRRNLSPIYYPATPIQCCPKNAYKHTIKHHETPETSSEYISFDNHVIIS